MLYSLMGLSPPRLHCDPAANYRSIIILGPVIARRGAVSPLQHWILAKAYMLLGYQSK